MTNPFEDENAEYLVLRNDAGEFSIWPVTIKIPNGWVSQRAPDTRATCLSYIEVHWKDMRPNRLAE